MKKSALGLLGLAVLSLSLSACGSSKDAEAKDDVKQDMTPYGKYEKSVEFTIGRTKYGGSDLPKGQTVSDNYATEYVEEKGNIKANVVWEAQDTTQKIALSISTGDIPDVMIVGRDQFKQLVDNDLIADLTDVYDKVASDYVKSCYDSFNGTILPQVTVDGKLMGLPTTAFSGEHNILWIRKDWLEKTGKSLPTTTDEVYDLAREFVKQDFAGDGKTVGLSMPSTVASAYGGTYGLETLFYANHSYPRNWIHKDGKNVYGTIQPETKEVLTQLAGLYKEGVIDKQFAVRKTEELTSLTTSGKLGMLFFPWWAPYSDLQKSIENDKNADWVCVSAPKDSDGKYTIPHNDPVGSIIVVRKGYAHPEAVMKSINLSQDFVYQVSDDAREYIKTNLPDLDKRWSHELVQIPGLIDNDDQLYNYTPLKKAIEAGSSAELEKDRPDLLPAYKNYEKMQASGSTSDPVAWGDITARINGKEAASLDKGLEYLDNDFFDQTPTMKKSWVNLTKLEDEMFVKIITGEEPVSYFDTFVEQWNKMGGEAITKEANE